MNAYKSLPEKEGKYLVIYESTSYNHPMMACVKAWDGKKWLGMKYQKNVRLWMAIPPYEEDDVE